MKTKIILASASTRRREILEIAKIPHEVIASKIEENITEKLSPDQIAIKFATLKAKSVKSQYNDNTIVVGCDTVVALNNEIFGKPKSADNAMEILKKLSGNVHQVYTGVYIIKNKKIFTSFVERTDVEFWDISEKEIKDYIYNKNQKWNDKAGGYGIQDAFGMKYVNKIIGDYYNVVGLPISRLYYELKKLENNSKTHI